jgi:hypothetical protein
LRISDQILILGNGGVKTREPLPSLSKRKGLTNLLEFIAEKTLMRT